MDCRTSDDLISRTARLQDQTVERLPVRLPQEWAIRITNAPAIAVMGAAVRVSSAIDIHHGLGEGLRRFLR
jgi:hypothetical protein